MNLLLVTFLVMALFITVMAVGVIFGRAPLKGSCGGLNKIGIDGKCEICGKAPDERCDNEAVQMKIEHKNRHDLAYDATKKPADD